MNNLLEVGTLSNGRVKDPSYIYIGDTVKKYTSLIKYRVGEMNRFVPKDHLLFKLISLATLPVVPDDNDILFFETRRSIRGLATSLDLTYLNNYGKLHKGSIIPGTTEAIVITARKDDKPIRILYHNHYNVDWELGNKNHPDAFAIIELNLYAIMKEYYKWKSGFNNHDNLFNFIYKVLLYPVIEDYIDLSLYNKNVFTRFGISMPKAPNVREFRIPMLEDRFAKNISNIINIQDKQHLNINEFLMHIELPFRDSARDLLVGYPDGVTHQARWVYTFAMIPFITDALDYAARGKNNKKAINRKSIGQLKRFVKNFKMQNPISPLPRLDQSYLLTYLERLDQILSRY